MLAQKVWNKNSEHVIVNWNYENYGLCAKWQHINKLLERPDPVFSLENLIQEFQLYMNF